MNLVLRSLFSELLPNFLKRRKIEPMAEVKNENRNAVVREPEIVGTTVERKDRTDKDAGEATAAPRTSGGDGR